jgi:inner membrane protein
MRADLIARMSPLTHLFASWLVAAKTTRNPRDCKLAALAGLLPDADGVGLAVDVANQALGHKPTHYYALYHHYWLHGLLGGVIIALALALFARDKWRVALVAFFLFHLHVLCDLVGSRGPSPDDLWPIFYFGPFDKDPMWLWKGQWRLDGWQNQLISVLTLGGVLWLAVRQGHSPLGLLNRRADERFVSVLQEWAAKLKRRLAG